MRILIVEDNRRLAESLGDILKSARFESDISYDGREGYERLMSGLYDGVLLDVMLPGMDGFAVCRRLRETSDVPIFFITARVLEEDELNGYAAGADDYVAKPFSLPVLYARIMAMMHRMRGGAPAERLAKGGVEVDLRTKRVRVRGEGCPLAPRDYDLLVFFLENPNRIFTRDQLLIRFWGYDFDGNERVIDNHIKKLRKALRGTACTIRTERKSGYRMEISS